MVVELVIVLGVPKQGINLDTQGAGVKPPKGTSDQFEVSVTVGLAPAAQGASQAIVIARTANSDWEAPETLYFDNTNAAQDWLERTSYGTLWAQSMTAIALQTIRVEIAGKATTSSS